MKWSFTVPITTSDAYERVLLALCCWREARGESIQAQRGVIWTILNRAAKPSWWGKDIVSVILAPSQFSSFNKSDPNSLLFPSNVDVVFREIVLLAADPGDDPTGGATSYNSLPMDNQPSWAAEMTKTCDIGAFHFYK